MTILPVRYKSYYGKAPFYCDVREECIRAIPPGHYLVKLLTCGLCHSDLVWIKYRAKDWEKIGHEFGGTVIDGAADANLFVKGEQVAVKNAAHCQVCVECKKNNFRQCQDVIVNKSGFDQYFLAHEKSLISAEGVSKSALGLVEPLNVANDVLETAKIDSQDSVAIIGLGTIGLLAGFLCSKKGATTYGISRRSTWFNVAFDLGFTNCFNTLAPNFTVNKILVFAPPSCLNEIVDLLQPGGSITIAGLNESDWDEVAPFNFEKIIFKHGSIHGAFAYPNLYFARAITQLKENKIIEQKLITHKFPLEHLSCFFNKKNALPEDYLKIIFRG